MLHFEQTVGTGHVSHTVTVIENLINYKNYQHKTQNTDSDSSAAFLFYFKEVSVRN